MATKKLATTKKAKTKRAPTTKASGGQHRGSGGDVVDVDVAVREAIGRHLAQMCSDGFFSPLVNDHPFMKVGIDGLAKVGKSQTLAELAIGLWFRIGSMKPVVLISTENAHRFLVPLFNAAGVPVVVRKTSSLVDWADAVQRAAAGESDIVITDSLTHIWESTVAAFCQANEVERVEGPSAWMALKGVWHREWAELFRDARVHLLHASRAGDNYVDVLGKDGEFDSVKVGTKVRGEQETAFEPSLLIHVERHAELGVLAHVEDRTREMHGETVPLLPGRVFSSFSAVVDATLANAVAPVATEQRSSVTLFQAGSGRARTRGLVGEVRGLLDRHWPSTSAADRQTRANALHQAFGHSSWPKLEKADEEALRAGLLRLQAICAAGGPTITPTPSPDGALATIRVGLSNDPGDPTERAKRLAVARTIAGQLPHPHRASALGIVERTARAWEQCDMDQRTTDSDELPC